MIFTVTTLREYKFSKNKNNFKFSLKSCTSTVKPILSIGTNHDFTILFIKRVLLEWFVGYKIDFKSRFSFQMNTNGNKLTNKITTKLFLSVGRLNINILLKTKLLYLTTK